MEKRFKIVLSTSDLYSIPGIKEIPYPDLFSKILEARVAVWDEKSRSEHLICPFKFEKDYLLLDSRAELRRYWSGFYYCFGVRTVEKSGPIFFDKSGKLVFTAWELRLDPERKTASFKLYKDSFGKTERFMTLDLAEIGRACVQTEETLEKIVENIDPYLLKFCKEKNVDYRYAIVFPKLEILWKAGYRIAQDIVSQPGEWEMQHMDVRKLAGLCNKSGTNPRTILDLPGYAQKMVKTLNLDDAYFLRSITRCYRISEAEVMYGWEKKTRFPETARVFDGKDVFYNQIRRFSKTPYIWWNELVEKVKKIHGYGWSRFYTGTFIKDYFAMCWDIGVEPTLNPKDIIPEHDRLAREYKEGHVSIPCAIEKRSLEEAKKYNYSEDKLFIRSVEGFKDIVDEGTQQHNCVASYWKRVQTGKTMIFLLRRKERPKNSYVTVELGLGGNIKQALSFGNSPIQEEETKKFLKAWKEFVVKKMKGRED